MDSKLKTSKPFPEQYVNLMMDAGAFTAFVGSAAILYWHFSFLYGYFNILPK